MKLLSLVLFAMFSFSSYAQIVARVIDVKGNAFSFMGKNAKGLKYGSKIHDLAEVMVEDGSTLSLVNPEGHIFHVNGGSLVKLYKGIIELKNGHVWVISSNKKKGLFNTSNSIGEYGEGQFIYSFDNISGKTQLLVLGGMVKFSNALEPKLFTKIHAGYFSLVDQKYENGLPRTPTKVGLNSYKQLKNVFANFKNIQSEQVENMLWGTGTKKKVNRGIASVTATRAHASRATGKIITIRTIRGNGSRVPASASPMEYYQNIKKAEAWKYKPLKNSKIAPIRYFGQKWKSKMVMTEKKPSAKKVVSEMSKKPSRLPASVGKSKFIEDLKKSDFEKSLNESSKKNQRHSNEVNNLIDELKTYKQDFKKNY